MIAGLLFLLGVLDVVVVLGVLRDGKRREEAWEEFWTDQSPMTGEERWIMRELLERQGRKGGRP